MPEKDDRLKVLLVGDNPDPEVVQKVKFALEKIDANVFVRTGQHITPLNNELVSIDGKTNRAVHLEDGTIAYQPVKRPKWVTVTDGPNRKERRRERAYARISRRSK